MKQCKHCLVEKPLAEFYADAAARDGHRPECKTCTAARRKQWYAQNRDRDLERVRRWQRENPERLAAYRSTYNGSDKRKRNNRAGHLRRKYGITPEQYDEMLAAQGGGCAICGRPPRPDISLHVDHHHESGQLRKLLCFPCNNLLGDAGDDPTLLARASSYLREHDTDPERLEELALIRERVRRLVPTG